MRRVNVGHCIRQRDDFNPSWIRTVCRITRCCLGFVGRFHHLRPQQSLRPAGLTHPDSEMTKEEGRSAPRHAAARQVEKACLGRQSGKNPEVRRLRRTVARPWHGTTARRRIRRRTSLRSRSRAHHQVANSASVEEAYFSGGSDIHIEPFEKEDRVALPGGRRPAKIA